MFPILNQYGIPFKIVNAIMQLYTNSKGVVSINGKTSKPFDIKTGVLQGVILAPFLFFIVMDYVINKCKGVHRFVYENRTASASCCVSARKLAFADDIALLERFISLTKVQLAKLSQSAREVGLIINTDKVS